MTFQTTAIAMAVAGVVAAPVAVQAGADEIYASARVGVDYTDKKGTQDTNISSHGSRFGARGETDLGNGLTAFGRYEWGVDFNGGSEVSDTDGEDVNVDSFSTRHRYVGLKGDFGSVTAGRTYHTFYNFAVGGTDVPWQGSGANMVAYVGRTDQGLTYAGGSDALAFSATVYMDRDDEEDAVDYHEVGASYTFGNDMTLGLAVQGTAADLDGGTGGTVTGKTIGNESDKTVLGVMLSGISLGDASLGFGYQSQDDDWSFLVDGSFNNFYAHFETEHLDSGSASATTTDDVDPVMYAIGYNQPLGRKTQMYYEAVFKDADSGDSDDDSTALYAVLKYDII
ncbi:MAG: porin [Gammaproteobacteria bacterium]|nr:porin [Gammaproteobacteria bacterium]